MSHPSVATTAPAVAPIPCNPADAPASRLAEAARLLLPHLEKGRRVDAAILRAEMEQAFGASDSSGAWDWKTAYDACEAATVLFLRRYGKPLFRKAGSPASRLAALTKIAGLLPTHTRRSEESQALQQFSTPIPLGLAALCAAAVVPGDRVLEPSAGTGLLAILAEIAAAVETARPSGTGVENCWSAWLSSERRVWVGRRPAIFASIGNAADGDLALRRSTLPYLRRNSTVAASQAS